MTAAPMPRQVAGDPAPSGVAAFDFDGTLISGDSLLTYLIRLVGARRLAGAAARQGPALVNAYRRGGRDQTKAVLFRTALAGVPLLRAQELGGHYGVELVRRVRPEMAQRVAWHRAQGHLVLLVSASLALYLQPLGNAMGFDRVIATRLASAPDGRLTGDLQGANVRGPEKARLLRDAVTGALGDRPIELWAYGDSPGDRDMLAMADHPLLVRRGRPRSTPGEAPC